MLLKNSNNLTKKDKARLNELMEYYHIDTVQAMDWYLSLKRYSITRNLVMELNILFFVCDKVNLNSNYLATVFVIELFLC